MRDATMVFFENADIATSPASNVIQVAASGDTSRVGALHRFAENVGGAIYMNVIVNSAITGLEVVTLEDSADGTTFAATSAVINVGAATAGSVFSIAIPSDVRNYLRAAETVGTAGKITVFLGQKLPLAAY